MRFLGFNDEEMFFDNSFYIRVLVDGCVVSVRGFVCFFWVVFT